MCPINLKLYPADWKTAIRPRILKRDRNRCRVCKVKNYTWGYREPDGTFVPAPGWSKEKGKTDREGHRIFRIQLNVAHLDHGLSDHSDANLKAMCARCHVLYDRRVTAPRAGFTLKYGRGTGLLPFDVVPAEAEAGQLVPAFGAGAEKSVLQDHLPVGNFQAIPV